MPQASFWLRHALGRNVSDFALTGYPSMGYLQHSNDTNPKAQILAHGRNIDITYWDLSYPNCGNIAVDLHKQRGAGYEAGERVNERGVDWLAHTSQLVCW